MTYKKYLEIVLLFGILVLFYSEAYSQEENKKKMVIAEVQVESLDQPITYSSTFTNILLTQAIKSKYYEVRLPEAYLNKIISQLRTEVISGRNAEEICKDIDSRKLGGEFLLLPTLSRLGNENLVTAVLIDLTNFSVKTYNVSNNGQSSILELLRQLWLQIEAESIKNLGRVIIHSSLTL
jgi:hypothetical protein